MRGGNRQVALIALDTLALAFLLALWLRSSWSGAGITLDRLSLRAVLIAFVLLSPAWLALVYLVPVPAGFWSGMPGREVYLPLLQAAGISPGARLPLSLVPDATRVSLLAGIPLVAAFLAGFGARLPQLRLVLGVVAAMAFAQILMGLLQVGGGQASHLYFGGDGGRPFGTFANANHFGNYIAMALAAYVWLAWSSITHGGMRRSRHAAGASAFPPLPTLWMAGGLLLVLGILLSRSRGAMLTGLPIGLLALAIALSAGERSAGPRFTLLVIGGLVAAALTLAGLGSVFARFDLARLSDSAAFRSLLATSTLEGAAAFWPWGAGWGTYGPVFPRFQPPAVDGYADHAHHDFAQMLFEGGVFALLLGAVCLWLAGARAAALARAFIRHRALRREEMASALCGLGLLGLLLHSLVEFNLHIPANAILGALLAGVYLRPLDAVEARRD